MHGLFFFTKAKTELRATKLSVTIKAATRNGSDADLTNKVARKLNIIATVKRLKIRHDVISAIWFITMEVVALQNSKEQVAAVLEMGTGNQVWLDTGSAGRLGLFDAFGAGGGSEWTLADTGDWLQAIDDWLGPKGHGFEKIYIHTTGEESHFQGAKYDAWLGFLALARGEGHCCRG